VGDGGGGSGDARAVTCTHKKEQYTQMCVSVAAIFECCASRIQFAQRLAQSFVVVTYRQVS
jgi:hypothetical protein